MGDRGRKGAGASSSWVARTVVDLVGDEVIRLDSSNVGIDQDRLDTSLLQGLESLRTCIMIMNVSIPVSYLRDSVVSHPSNSSQSSYKL